MLTEHQIQARAVGYLRQAGVRFFAVPNGGKRSGATAAILWQEGVEKGVPDLIIIDPPRGEWLMPDAWVGTVIEIKREGGKASKEQLKWLSEFSNRGWRAHIACGLPALLQILCDYGYLDAEFIAKRERVDSSCGAGDGNTPPSRPKAGPRRGAGARSRTTASPLEPPNRDKGGEG